MLGADVPEPKRRSERVTVSQIDLFFEKNGTHCFFLLQNVRTFVFPMKNLLLMHEIAPFSENVVPVLGAEIQDLQKDPATQINICQTKNLDFLLKNLHFLSKNLHFPLKNLHFC